MDKTSKKQIYAETGSQRDSIFITAGKTEGATCGQSEQDRVELRSEEMNDILTRPPHILIRSGISVICGIILLLLTGSFFFKYPDVVQGEILITTQNPPVWLVAKTSGKIRELTAGLTTNTGQILDFTGELTGQAEIITDDRSLFSRILSPLQYLLKKHGIGK